MAFVKVDGGIFAESYWSDERAAFVPEIGLDYIVNRGRVDRKRGRGS